LGVLLAKKKGARNMKSKEQRIAESESGITSELELVEKYVEEALDKEYTNGACVRIDVLKMTKDLHLNFVRPIVIHRLLIEYQKKGFTTEIDNGDFTDRTQTIIIS
jgi:hypothetical protein